MDLVLHPDAEANIQQVIVQPPQAVVLSGPKGLGKTHIARHIALQLLATDSLTNNPYYRLTQPTKGTITIEQVRQLIKFFNLTVPGSGATKRVAVIEDADTMGVEAQNALLKLLEEPPAGSVLILTSSHLLGLLPTVRSRLQLSTIPEPSSDALLAFFTAQNHDKTAVQKVLLRYGSDVAAIQQALSTDDNSQEPLLDIAKQVLRGSTYERLLLVDSLAKQKEQAILLVETLGSIATASLHAAAIKNANSLSRWQSVLQAVTTAQDALNKNGNTKLVLTDMMLNL